MKASSTWHIIGPNVGVRRLTPKGGVRGIGSPLSASEATVSKPYFCGEFSFILYVVLHVLHVLCIPEVKSRIVHESHDLLRGREILQSGSLVQDGFLSPHRIPIIIKLGPLEKRTPFFSRCKAGIAHPHVSPSRLILALCTPENGVFAALATWSVAWV